MRSSIVKTLLLFTLFIVLVSTCVLFSTDPVSTKIRHYLEASTNSYIKDLAERAALKQLTSVDESVLRASVAAGIAISKLKYPEAAHLLQHYVNGDGSELELDSKYFKSSKYLSSVIFDLGVGDHGPLTLKQSQDWRLSLAFNPYYLKISCEKVRLYHKKISFAPVDGERVHTIVPVGKMKIKVIDNLISALNPKPFSVYSEWIVESGLEKSNCS